MGARLLLLGSVRSGTDEMMRSRLHDAQRRIHLRMEVSAFLLALLPGLYPVYAGRAAGLSATLVVLALVMVFAALTKF